VGNDATATANAKALSKIEMQTASSFSGFDFDNTWTIEASKNQGFPYLTNLPIIEKTSGNDNGGDNPSGGRIFNTRYASNFLNWILFFIGFGWIWMWF